MGKKPKDRRGDRLITDLPELVEAPNESLPHAAMSLGSPANVSRMVKRLVIERSAGMWMLYRLDESGGFVGDSTHASLEDAMHQARREFGVRAGDFSSK